MTMHAAHRAGLGQVGLAHDRLVPVGEVLLASDGQGALAHWPVPNPILPATDRALLGVSRSTGRK